MKPGLSRLHFGKINQQEPVINSGHSLLLDSKSCSIRRDIRWGKNIHAKAVESQNVTNVHVMGALINMYSKCGSTEDARQAFDSIQKPDVVCWTVLLLGYAENGEGIPALQIFSKMKAGGYLLDSIAFVASLKACTSLVVNGNGNRKRECLEWGREIHLQIGGHLNHYVQNTLINMYAKCGSMVDARRVFDSIQRPNVVCWTALLLGYAENGEGITSLELFSKMKSGGCVPDSVTYVAVLKACTSLVVNGDCILRGEYLRWGRQIHLEIDACHMNGYVQNTLIDMYAKCGSMVDARRMFDSIQRPNVVSWTALLLGYAENGEELVALELFSRMKVGGCVPNSLTYIAALKACTSLAVNGDGNGKRDCLDWGRDIHLSIGCQMDCYVQSTFIDMYAKCGSMSDARRVFESISKPDVVAWTALLLGYADNGEGLAALDLFSRMRCVPNSVTYIAVLRACSLIGSLDLGRKFHSKIIDFSTHVVTCLVDFYAKCGSMVEACEVFDMDSRKRDVSTWTALISGYGRLGDCDSVINLFRGMQDEGLQPDPFIFVCMLTCCSHAGLVDKAREYFEAMTVQYEVIPTIVHHNGLVDVLGRANQLNEVSVLRKMPCNPDVVTWTTVLCACRKWRNIGIGRLAFQSLVDMDRKDQSAYILMAHIYGSRGMWEEQNRVLEAVKLFQQYICSSSLTVSSASRG